MRPQELLQIFARFFHPEKSPHTSISIDPLTKLFRFDYFPKHWNMRDRLVWDSRKKGTYIRQKHGRLKINQNDNRKGFTKTEN